MPLTRAQLLMGNSTQGPVLSGQVQGVTQGRGVKISRTGAISVDSTGIDGFVKLNNGEAFNLYIWPDLDGDAGQVLTTNGAGILSWSTGFIKLNNPNAYNDYVWPSDGGQAISFLRNDGEGGLTWANAASLAFVTVSSKAPPEVLGSLWYDCSTGYLKLFQNCVEPTGWTPVADPGLEVLASKTSSDPGFISGSGSLESPFTLGETSVPQNGCKVVATLTVTGLAPNQFVPVRDLNFLQNEGRFYFTNNYADSNGELTLQVGFKDQPESFSNDNHSAQIQIGYSSVYVQCDVVIVPELILVTPGEVSGVLAVNETIDYTEGFTFGGVSPTQASWNWVDGDGQILQSGGSSYFISPSLLGKNILVEFFASDSVGQTVSGSTPEMGPVRKESFPCSVPFPTDTVSPECFTWGCTDTTLSSDGCIEFSVNGSPYTQGPQAIDNGDTICSRWSSATPSVCANAPNGTVIDGCLFDPDYETCGSLRIDRIPSPFSFPPVGGLLPSTVATSAAVTPVGYNSTSYVTGSVPPGCSNLQGSLDAGVTWSPIPSNGSSFPINPGQSIRVRFTVGAQALATYVASVFFGEGSSYITAPFSAATTSNAFPGVSINFPTIADGVTTASTLWTSIATTIQSTGTCVEFSLDGGSTFTQNATPISTSDTLLTRWVLSPACGEAPSGTVITGTIRDSTYHETGSLTLDSNPVPFQFTNLTNQPENTVITNPTPVTPLGYNAISFVTLGLASTLTSVQASINGGAFVNVPSQGSQSLPIRPGQTINVRGTTGSGVSTGYQALIYIGDTRSVWTVSTTASVPSVATPSILSPVNGSTNLNPNANSPAGISVTSSAYQATGGAGPQESSSWEVYSGAPGTGSGGTLVYSSQSDTVNLTSWFIPASYLTASTNYYVRVQYTSSFPVATSAWSNYSSFSTASSFCGNGNNFAISANSKLIFATATPGFVVGGNGKFIVGAAGMKNAVTGATAPSVLAVSLNNGATWTDVTSSLPPGAGVPTSFPAYNWGFSTYYNQFYFFNNQTNSLYLSSDAVNWATTNAQPPGLSGKGNKWLYCSINDSSGEILLTSVNTQLSWSTNQGQTWSSVVSAGSGGAGAPIYYAPNPNGSGTYWSSWGSKSGGCNNGCNAVSVSTNKTSWVNALYSNNTTSIASVGYQWFASSPNGVTAGTMRNVPSAFSYNVTGALGGISLGQSFKVGGKYPPTYGAGMWFTNCYWIATYNAAPTNFGLAFFTQNPQTGGLSQVFTTNLVGFITGGAITGAGAYGGLYFCLATLADGSGGSAYPQGPGAVIISN